MWQDIALPLMRGILNDYGETPTYSDSRLEEVLIVGAYMMVAQTGIDDYTINVPALTISPDPSSSTSFINLMVLKAACFIDQGAVRTKLAVEGIRATLGPANISVAGNLKGYLDMLDRGPCSSYEAALNDYLFGDGIVCRAILSPFASPRFEPGLGISSNSERSHYSSY